MHLLKLLASPRSRNLAIRRKMSLDLLQTKEINIPSDFEKDSCLVMENDGLQETEELELKQFERLEDLLRQSELEPLTDDCAEMIDNVEFVDDLEDVDESDLIDDIAADLLANVCCEWEKADQEYLGVASSGDHQFYDPDHEEAPLTIFEQMMQTEFWSLDQDEAESQESGVFDMSNTLVTQDDDDDYNEGGDMNKEEIEAEFYELLQNMVHELNQVKTPVLPLDSPVMAGYDDDRSAISLHHDRVFRAIITDLSLREFLVTLYVTIITVMAGRLRHPVTCVTRPHKRRREGAGLQNVTFYEFHKDYS